MDDISIVALFCEDIREEKSGTETIVGVFPDNLSLSHVPGAFPKLCVYVRMHMRPHFDPGPIFTRVVMPDGKELGRSDIQPKLVEETRKQAESKGSPYVGFISKFVITPFAIVEIGRIQVVVTVGGKEYVAGALNLELAPAQAT